MEQFLLYASLTSQKKELRTTDFEGNKSTKTLTKMVTIRDNLAKYTIMSEGQCC